MFNKFLNSSKLWEKLQKKIYCCDRGDNDNSLAAAILAGNNRRDDWGPMAAMMGGGMNNWMNNPFAYLMFMALLRNGGFGKIEGSIGEMKELMKKQQEMMENFIKKFES